MVQCTKSADAPHGSCRHHPRVYATDSLGAWCSVQVDRAVRSNDDEHDEPAV